jgi:hypothetical protein
MSSNGKRRHGASPAYLGKRTAPQPGDEAVGAFSREQLARMDSRFAERLLRAFETGRESREAAEATYANASRLPSTLRRMLALTDSALARIVTAGSNSAPPALAAISSVLRRRQKRLL